MEISIKGIDESKTKRIPGKNIFEIYLKLSETPDYDWKNFFKHARKYTPRAPKTDFKDGSLVIHTTLENFKNLDLKILNEDIKKANDLYKKECERKKEEEKKKQEQLKKEEEGKRITRQKIQDLNEELFGKDKLK